MPAPTANPVTGFRALPNKPMPNPYYYGVMLSAHQGRTKLLPAANQHRGGCNACVASKRLLVVRATGMIQDPDHVGVQA